VVSVERRERSAIGGRNGSRRSEQEIRKSVRIRMDGPIGRIACFIRA